MSVKSDKRSFFKSLRVVYRELPKLLHHRTSKILRRWAIVSHHLLSLILMDQATNKKDGEDSMQAHLPRVRTKKKKRKAKKAAKMKTFLR